MKEMKNIMPFHLAFPVNSLEESRKFYVNLLGCKEGRSSAQWIDFDFFGHQIVAHLCSNIQLKDANMVDGHGVPVPHFGLVMIWEDWKNLSEKLKKAGVEFVIEPYIRFKNQKGEQATMFLLDPSGNALEFKAFRNIENLFTK